MHSIPDLFPAAAIDKIISSGQDVGIADFMLQMELVFEHGLDAQRLARALELMLDAQPVLGCRLVTEKKKVYWERKSTGVKPQLSTIDIIRLLCYA